MSTKHTQTPLRPLMAQYDSRPGVLPPGDWCVWYWPAGDEPGRRLLDGLTKEQAQHIVRCVNSHDALVEALRRILTVSFEITSRPEGAIGEARAIARAALRAATGEG
jgi:hypothetical protein